MKTICIAIFVLALVGVQNSFAQSKEVDECRGYVNSIKKVSLAVAKIEGKRKEFARIDLLTRPLKKNEPQRYTVESIRLIFSDDANQENLPTCNPSFSGNDTYRMTIYYRLDKFALMNDLINKAVGDENLELFCSFSGISEAKFTTCDLVSKQ